MKTTTNTKSILAAIDAAAILDRSDAAYEILKAATDAVCEGNEDIARGILWELKGKAGRAVTKMLAA